MATRRACPGVHAVPTRAAPRDRRDKPGGSLSTIGVPAMVGDVLSQAEVESLLSAMDTPTAAKKSRDSVESGAAAAADMEHRAHSREKVIPYDFKRPERVGK